MNRPPVGVCCAERILDFTLRYSLSDIVEHVSGVLTEDQVCAQQRDALELLKCALLGLLADLNPGLLERLGHREIVLNRAHSNKRVNTVLFSQLGSPDEEVVLVSNH